MSSLVYLLVGLLLIVGGAIWLYHWIKQSNEKYYRKTGKYPVGYEDKTQEK